MKIKFLISAFTFGFFLFLASKTIAKDSARFSLGIGVFNYMEDGSPPHNDQSGMINLEIHSGKKMFNLIKKIKPSDEEIEINPRSRSAKINVLEKQS